jgi:hypothetical protein
VTGGAARTAAVAIFAGCVAGLAGAVPAAFAAEPCSNAKYRTGPSLTLPDCRAYEMVTPPEKFDQIRSWPSSTASSTAPPSFVTASGDRLAYAVASGKLADDPSVGVIGGWERGVRTPAGWSIESASSPPQGPFFAPLTTPATWVRFSDDVSKMAFTSGTPYSPLQQPSDGRRDWYGAAHLTDGKTATWLSKPTWAGALPAMNSADAAVMRWRVDGGSPSLDTVYFSSQGTHTEADGESGRPPLTAWAVYRWSDGELANAGVLPDGTVSRGGSTPADHSGVITDVGATSPDNIEAKTANAVSRDGRSLLFVSPDPLNTQADPTLPAPQLYLAREGEPTILLSGAFDDGDPPVATPVADTEGVARVGTLGRSATVHAVYALATPDHSVVVFATPDVLTDDAPTDQPDVHKTYVYDSQTRDLDYVPGAGRPRPNTGPEPDPVGLPDRSKGNLIALSPDGTKLLYVSESGELRLWRRGASTLLVSTDVANSSFTNATSTVSAVRFSADGERVFLLSNGPLRGEARHVRSDNGATPRSHIYVYSVPDDGLECISCKAGYETFGFGASFSGTAANRFSSASGTSIVQAVPSRGITESGDAVAFTSDDPLTDDDHNAKRDVYLRKDGVLRLLSSGATGAADQMLYDINADGSDVFILSREHLVPWDTDGLYDIYDVRVGGGFDPPVVASVPCAGDECQGVVGPGDGGRSAGSESATGAGDAKPNRVSARLTVSQRSAGLRAAIAVRVSGPGRVRVSGAGVKTVTKSVGRPGQHRVVLRLNRKAAKTLARRGKVSRRVRVSFRARSGPGVSRRVTVRFKKAGARRASAATSQQRGR